MCYSGNCKYEQPMGDCSIVGLKYPEDALCILTDRQIDSFFGNVKETFSYKSVIKRRMDLIGD